MNLNNACVAMETAVQWTSYLGLDSDKVRSVPRNTGDHDEISLEKLVMKEIVTIF